MYNLLGTMGQKGYMNNDMYVGVWALGLSKLHS